MFERVRQSFRDMLASAPPGERRAVLTEMKQTLVQARMGLDDLRDGVARTRAKLEAERRELSIVQRRKGLAATAGDTETVAIAERFERQHGEHVAALERKLEGAEAELALVEGEVQEMSAELKLAMTGASLGGAGAGSSGRMRDGTPGAPGSDPLDDGAAVSDAIDGLGRAQRRAERDADADARLEALKRRMGK